MGLVCLFLLVWEFHFLPFSVHVLYAVHVGYCSDGLKSLKRVFNVPSALMREIVVSANTVLCEVRTVLGTKGHLSTQRQPTVLCN
jgi:hypothetical protein